MGFEQFLRLIADGEPVAAGTANRPIRDVDQNVRYLYDLVRAAEIGSTVFARQQTVESAALPGMPVYWNPASQRFERGLAQVQAQAVGGQLVTSPSSQVWGVVYQKTDATLADVLLFGYAQLDVSQAVAGAVVAGTYYLSGTTPGALTRQRPPVSVPVLRADGLGNVFVVPQFVDLLDRHVHYRFPLECRPAGVASTPMPGDPHAITAPDATLPGWLPASHPSFGGLAPAGAAFGYNLAAHPQLRDAWPPLPASNAYLEWDRGLDRDVGYTGVPLGPDGACILDRNGIWWMSDCWGDVPWPDYFSLADPDAVSQSLSEPLQCPRPLNMAMQVWFTRLNFTTDATVVTSLRSADPRIVVSCVDGTPATVGDLEVALALVLQVRDGQDGYLAFKELDGDVLRRGPVQEGLYSLSPNITLSSPVQRLLTPGDATSPVLYQGPVGISVGQSPTRELDVLLTRLDVAEEEFYQDTTYIAFYAGQVASIRSKVNIPSDVTLPSPVVALRFRLMGRAIGGLPALTLTARRVPRPDPASATPPVLPGSAAEFAVVIDTAADISQANQYVEAQSAPFPVAPGDILFFTLARSDADTYPGDVGVLQQVAILSAGPGS